MKRLSTIFILLLASSVCRGQSTGTSVIVGTVTDPTGAVVPGVTILARNTATGAVRTVTSDDLGNYRVEALVPGNYVVRAEHKGFSKLEVANVTLLVTQVLRVDLKMAVGDVTQTVTVTAFPLAVNTETSTIGEVVTQSKVANLPLNGRQFYALAQLVPGAYPVTQTKQGTLSNQTYASKGYFISFSGGRGGYNSYNVDGAESLDPQTNQLIASVPLDAVQEFRVSTDMYSAQSGRAGGAVVDIATKSGTNRFHGSAYDYHRNKSLDALPYFYKGTTANRPNYLRNQYGGSIGGPIVKNKTFFFFSPEWLHMLQPGQLYSSWSATAQERQGDLSQSNNGYTGKPVVLTNPYTKQIIPSSILPSNLITQVGQNLLSIWPLPNYNLPGGTNYRVFRSGPQTSAMYQARVDHNFNEKNRLMGSFNLGNSYSLVPGVFQKADTSFVENDRTVIVGYTTVLSPTLLNDFRFSRTWHFQGSDFATYNKDQNYAKAEGIWTGDRSVNAVPAPGVYGNGTTAWLGNYGLPLTWNNFNWIFKDALSWRKGSHNFNFGADFLRQGYNWVYDFSALGHFRIGQNDGASIGTWNISGSGIADLLMGLSAQDGYSAQAARTMQYRRDVLGSWIQDDWKVSKRLTLNLGVRYDYVAPFGEITNNFVTFDFSTAYIRIANNAPSDLVALAKYPYETGGPNIPYPPNKKNFSPRVGFALRPFSDNRTAIRAGYGIFYTSPTGYYTTYGSWVQPFGGFYYYYRLPAFSFDGKDRTLTPISQTPPDYQSFLGKSPGSVYLTAPKMPNPYIQQYNLALEREFLSGRLVGELSYVGSKGTHLTTSESVVEYGGPALVSKITQVYGSTWGGPSTVFAANSNSKYNALQAKAKSQVGKGFNFLASYTWGKAMAQASSEEFNDNETVDLRTAVDYNVRRFYSLSDFDMRQRFVVSGGWEVPVGRGRRFGSAWPGVADAVLGGWEGHWIASFNSGIPWSVFTTLTRLPDRTCNGNLPPSQRTPTHWFDYTCFVAHPSTYVPNPNNPSATIETNYQGNAGSNIITGPGFNDFDFGIHKDFRIREGLQLQFRGEVFNAFNHPNLIGPSSYQRFTNTASGAQITRQLDSRDIQLALKILF